MKKKGIALFLAIFLMYASLPITLAEGETIAELVVGTVDATADSEVTVPVTIRNCEMVDSLQFHLNYDSTALSVVRVTPGDTFPAEYCVTNVDEKNRIRAACISALGLTGEGTVLSVTFKVLTASGSAVTVTDAAATRVNADFQQSKAYLTFTDGGVTVASVALPAPVVTPWIAATPVPTPSPEPTPTPMGTPAVIENETIQTPAGDSAMTAGSPKTLLIVLIIVAVMLIAAALVIVLTEKRNQKKKRRKPGK